MKPNDKGFSSVQEEYLKGFFQGVAQRPVINPFGGSGSAVPAEPEEETVHGTPVEDLCKEEKIKLEKNGLDVWDTMLKNGKLGEFPQGGDAFRYKFYGMFHVAPTQDSFMLRCRIPGGQLLSHQLIGLADIAEHFAGGYLDITTRANIQIREFMPANVIPTLTKLSELGLTSKGAGADNVRNVTATPTAGYDAREILDVLPFAKEMHHTILNNRDLYGLPRKFNIAYDGGGSISACADTNDIAFYAVNVPSGKSAQAGVYFRVQLCGITGHKQFASDCGILIRPEQHAEVACAMLRVFIENGDRTNRNRARLKYLIDQWGQEKFLTETESKLGYSLPRFPLEDCEKRAMTNQQGHIGVHPQKDEGLSYVGVLVPVGRLKPDQLRNIASAAYTYGRGEIRLTVWQNLIIPYVPNEKIDELILALKSSGLSCEANPFTGGLVACTGNTGCKYAASNTKGQAVILADELAKRVALDHPINIHLTGCPHSCAQHYIGDIGLIGTPSEYQGESVEGYSIVFGGGVEERQGIAREVFKAIPFQEIPNLLEACLNTYLRNRQDTETFNTFVRRHSQEELETLFLSHANHS